jgi:DNA-directed RNA polymerase specialized sigma24 family protein
MEEDDIAQQAYIICMQIFPKWDGTRSLENFLMLSVSNRLISESRTYYRNSERRKSIDFMELHDQPHNDESEFFEKIDNSEEIEFILEKLPNNLRNDYLRLANGVSIPSTRKDAVFKAVRDLYEKG